MEHIGDVKVFLFLLGAVTILLVILAFFVPVFLLGISKDLKDIKRILEKDKEHLKPEPENSQKLHDIFLSMYAEISGEEEAKKEAKVKTTTERSDTIS